MDFQIARGRPVGAPLHFIFPPKLKKVQTRNNNIGLKGNRAYNTEIGKNCIRNIF